MSNKPKHTENLFKMPIKNITWWERIMLIFTPKFLMADIGKDNTVYCLNKKFFGKLYIIKMWECPTSKKINGTKADYVVMDEAISLTESKEV